MKIFRTRGTHSRVDLLLLGVSHYLSFCWVELVQFSSVAQSCPTLCDPIDYSMLGFSVHHQLLELAQNHVHRVSDTSNHLVLCPFPPASVFPSIRVFSNESVLHIRWPKYWSFSFSISTSNEYSGLISFRMDWLDLLAVQGTLKSLLQYQSSSSTKILALGLKQLKTLEKLSLQLAWIESFSRDLCLPWPLSGSLFFRKLVHFF